MRLFCLLPLGLALTAAVAPADRGPGIAGEPHGQGVAYRAAGFDRVALTGAAGMDVVVGPAFSVVATGPDRAIRTLRVTVEDNALKIERRTRNARADPEESRVRFAVTMPRIAGAAVGGSGSIHVDRAEGRRFDAALGGSGSLTIDRIVTDATEVSIGGSGRVAAAGTTGALKVNLGGSGGLDAPRLRARSATVAAAGSGRVRASVDGDATVTAAGSGEVDLGSGAHCTVARLGSARVRCGG